MVEAAIREFPSFFVDDIELKRPFPSLTAETLQTFVDLAKQEAIPPQFYLLLGEDTAAHFSKWHASLEILQMATLLIGSRDHFPLSASPPEEIQVALEKGRVEIRKMEISSSAIRKRLAEGRCCAHLVPAAVLEYIYAHELYGP